MSAPKTALPAGAPVTADPAPLGGASTYRCANPECGHLDVFHAFNTKKTARTDCSRHEGAQNTRCPCTAFTTELPDFPQEND